jgi:hypothetical protein
MVCGQTFPLVLIKKIGNKMVHNQTCLSIFIRENRRPNDPRSNVDVRDQTYLSVLIKKIEEKNNPSYTQAPAFLKFKIFQSKKESALQSYQVGIYVSGDGGLSYNHRSVENFKYDKSNSNQPFIVKLVYH